MQRITWYATLAVVALVAPIGGQAQAQKAQAQIPRANVRELATIEGDTSGFVLLPGGRTLIYCAVTDGNNLFSPRLEDSTFAYDVATKRRTLLGTNMLPASVSGLGDRLAFTRSSADRKEHFVWTMPIDPKTGIGIGQAQRVSLRSTSGRERASISPDGQMLTFFAGPRTDGTWDLTLVPATGGTERIVANYASRTRHGWSADGKSLYVENIDAKTSIARVPLEGGRTEALFSDTNAGNALGLSPDARIAFFLVNPGRFSYRTASGVEGEISAALPPRDNGWGYNLTLDSSMRYATMTQVLNQRVRVLDLATGQSRDLLPAEQTSAPAWSPDGRRIAVLTGSLSHFDIMLSNSDGSSPRHYQMPLHLDGKGQSPWGGNQPWSPDGRTLAFGASTGGVEWASGDKGQLGLLDVNSGQTRVLATSVLGMGAFIWRSDGKAMRFLKRTAVSDGSAPRWSIAEVPLNGAERTLRDISTEFPRVMNVTFISDSSVVVRVSTDLNPERFLVPLGGGVATRLQDPGIEPGSRLGGTLVAGSRLLIGQVDTASNQARVIKIVSTAGEPTRTLRIPFDGHHGVPHPDGKQIINVGKATGDTLWKLFLVPLDGSPTRVIGEIPRGTGGLLAVSPDGKLLAYTSDGLRTSKILEIDFNPALQAIGKR